MNPKTKNPKLISCDSKAGEGLSYADVVDITSVAQHLSSQRYKQVRASPKLGVLILGLPIMRMIILWLSY